PQMIKSYASQDYKYMTDVLYQSTRFSYILMLLISIPLFIEMEFILKTWLTVVPDYTVIFCRLFIINNLIDCLSATLVTPIQATGNIKRYQIISGLILLLNVPLTYYLYRFGGAPEGAIYINIVITLVVLYVRLAILKSLIKFSIRTYLYKVVLTSFILTLFSFVLPAAILFLLESGFLRLLCVVATASV